MYETRIHVSMNCCRWSKQMLLETNIFRKSFFDHFLDQISIDFLHRPDLHIDIRRLTGLLPRASTMFVPHLQLHRHDLERIDY